MPTVTLTTPDLPPRTPPGRVLLTLAELVLLTRRAGGVRLPLDLHPPAADGPDVDLAAQVEQRLAADDGPAAAQARRLLARELDRAEEDPAVAAGLARKQVVDDAGTPVAEVRHALDVLAAPEALLVVDLSVRDVDPPVLGAPARRLRTWVAVAGRDVAQLATSSGAEHELAWCDRRGLGAALTRVATVEAPAPPDDEPAAPLPARFVVPFEQLTTAGEACARGRADLLDVVAGQAPASVEGRELDVPQTAALLRELGTRATGRLRVLVSAPAAADVPSAPRGRVGVVSWMRYGDSWYALRPRTVAGTAVVDAARVAPSDLAAAVAPVLAEVVR